MARATGWIEHDCLDCGRSWDLRGKEVDQCRWNGCRSFNIVKRPRPMNSYQDLMSDTPKHDKHNTMDDRCDYVLQLELGNEL